MYIKRWNGNIWIKHIQVVLEMKIFQRQHPKEGHHFPVLDSAPSDWDFWTTQVISSEAFCRCRTWLSAKLNVWVLIYTLLTWAPNIQLSHSKFCIKFINCVSSFRNFVFVVYMLPNLLIISSVHSAINAFLSFNKSSNIQISLQINNTKSYKNRLTSLFPS